MIDYRYSPRTTDYDIVKDFLLWQNFEDLPAGKLKTLKEWSDGKDWFVSSKGGSDWEVALEDENQYVQYSARNAGGACEAWLVTPEITLGTGDKLSFDAKGGVLECGVPLGMDQHRFRWK